MNYHYDYNTGSFFEDEAADETLREGGYPETYLHVEEMSSGEKWVVPISDETPLDLRALCENWVEETYCGNCELFGDMTPSLQGDYYAAIYTDGRTPEGGVCWEGAGFYIQFK